MFSASQAEVRMGFLKKKVIFDTDVVMKAAEGAISAGRWDRVSRYISRQCRYCISLNTMYEVLNSVAGGDGAHFIENKTRLRWLWLSSANFLPPVGDFVRKTVFSLSPRKPDFQPHRLRVWPAVVLAASKKNQLESGLISGAQVGKTKAITYGFKLQLLREQVHDGCKWHAETLENLRKGVLKRSTECTWAAGVLGNLGVPVSVENTKLLRKALDAAYLYDTFLYDLAEKQVYDFARWDSDWLDSQQLYYLADQSTLLVTCDAKIKHRTKGSSQAARILTFEELEELACAHARTSSSSNSASA